MLSLIWKDARQTLWPAILAAVFLFAPAVIWLVATVYDRSPNSAERLGDEFKLVCMLGAGVSIVAASSIASVAFAKERRERTADLLATLPIPRRTVVLSKLAAALLVTLTPIAIGLGAAALQFEQHDMPGTWDAQSTGQLTHTLLIASSLWAMLFGLGWGLSSVLRSEVLAAAIPILLAILIPFAVVAWTRPDHRLTWLEEEAHTARVIAYIAWTFGLLGVASFAAGTTIALRRRSP